MHCRLVIAARGLIGAAVAVEVRGNWNLQP